MPKVAGGTSYSTVNTSFCSSSLYGLRSHVFGLEYSSRRTSHNIPAAASSSLSLHHAYWCIPGSFCGTWVSESLGGRAAFGETCQSCSLARSSKEARKKGRIRARLKKVCQAIWSIHSKLWFNQNAPAQLCFIHTYRLSGAVSLVVRRHCVKQILRISISSRCHTFFCTVRIVLCGLEVERFSANLAETQCTLWDEELALCKARKRSQS